LTSGEKGRMPRAWHEEFPITNFQFSNKSQFIKFQFSKQLI